MSSSSSRRTSVATLPPSPTTSQPPTPTSKTAPGTPSLRSRSKGSLNSNSSSQRKVQPIRRCQSMRHPNSKSSGHLTGSGQITPSPSLRSRRVSSTTSIENSKWDSDFVKYYQYKTNRVDPVTLLGIAVVDSVYEYKENVSRVLMFGSPGCGKSSIITQFQNHLEEQNSATFGRRRLNQGFSEPALLLHFREIASFEDCLPRLPVSLYQPEAYIVVYAVNDRESFEGAKELIEELQKWDTIETRPVILVANKTDLVRSRTISKQEGRQFAISNNCKYIETSCAISLNVDFLLAGIGAQINLKSKSRCEGHPNRKLSIFRRLLKRAVLNKSQSCDNLHVL